MRSQCQSLVDLSNAEAELTASVWGNRLALSLSYSVWSAE